MAFFLEEIPVRFREKADREGPDLAPLQDYRDRFRGLTQGAQLPFKSLGAIGTGPCSGGQWALADKSQGGGNEEYL